MAKKQQTDTPAPETSPAAPAPAAEEPKKGKPPREPKAKEAKTKPEAAAAAGINPPAAVPDTTPTPAVAPAPVAEAAKKKGKRPGKAPGRGKKLKNQLKNIEQRIAKETPAPLKRAVGLLKQVKRAKFDETVEVHMALGVDTTQSDQMIRGSVSLPHGLGKVKRVVVFCQGDNVARAQGAGADYAGGDDLIEKIQKQNWLDFDVALATQDMMGKVSRLGKVLGPRGLMPTPKAGTVITANQDVAQAVREQKAGKVEYRTDKGGNVHAGIGKMSFDEDRLVDNINAFIDQIKAVKPAGVKGHYVKSITVSGTMTPGIAVTV
jgi:large subunit ribosomal protein L1